MQERSWLSMQPRRYVVVTCAVLAAAQVVFAAQPSERIRTMTRLAAVSGAQGGGEIRLTAVVTLVDGGAGVQDGTVEFLDSGVPIGSAQVVDEGGGAAASIEARGLATGMHHLAARFIGSESLDSSLSPVTIHVVTAGR